MTGVEFRCRSGRRGIAIGFADHFDDVLVRDFPTEIAALATLLKNLFQEDGAANVANEGSRSRQENVAGSVLHFDLQSQEGCVARHTERSLVLRS